MLRIADLGDVTVVFDIDYEHLEMMSITAQMMISAFEQKPVALPEQRL